MRKVENNHFEEMCEWLTTGQEIKDLFGGGATCKVVTLEYDGKELKIFA